MASGKLFFIKFVTGDWIKDPAVRLLRPSTRGIWIDAICAMHEMDQCGELQGSIPDLARVCCCTPNEMRVALDDLKSRNAADVTERNGIVTLVNRRMRREWTVRKSNRDRQQRHRSKGVAGDVTPDVTPPDFPIQSQRSDTPKSPEKGTEEVTARGERKRTGKERIRDSCFEAIERATP